MVKKFDWWQLLYLYNCINGFNYGFIHTKESIAPSWLWIIILVFSSIWVFIHINEKLEQGYNLKDLPFKINF
jgi:hypothetical protein